jgi:ATP-dependent DNA ligase
MLASVSCEPFDHSNWLFELKHDGFRAMAFIEDGHCRLISRNSYRFGGFRELARWRKHATSTPAGAEAGAAVLNRAG